MTVDRDHRRCAEFDKNKQTARDPEMHQTTNGRHKSAQRPLTVLIVTHWPFFT